MGKADVKRWRAILPPIFKMLIQCTEVESVAGGGQGQWGFWILVHIFPFATFVQISHLTSVFFTYQMGIIYTEQTS